MAHFLQPSFTGREDNDFTRILDADGASSDEDCIKFVPDGAKQSPHHTEASQISHVNVQTNKNGNCDNALPNTYTDLRRYKVFFPEGKPEGLPEGSIKSSFLLLGTSVYFPRNRVYKIPLMTLNIFFQLLTFVSRNASADAFELVRP